MNQRQYTEVTNTSNNERWEPQKSNQQINPNSPPTIEGYYKKQREQTGANGAFIVHEIALVDASGNLSQDIDVSGGVALDDMLEKIPLGTFICLQYLGKVPSKTPGRSYNNWKLFKDDNAIPYNKLAGNTGSQQQVSSAAPVYNNQAPVPNTNQGAQHQGFQQQGNMNHMQQRQNVQQTNTTVQGMNTMQQGNMQQQGFKQQGNMQQGNFQNNGNFQNQNMNAGANQQQGNGNPFDQDLPF